MQAETCGRLLQKREKVVYIGTDDLATVTRDEGQTICSFHLDNNRWNMYYLICYEQVIAQIKRLKNE